LEPIPANGPQPPQAAATAQPLSAAVSSRATTSAPVFADGLVCSLRRTTAGEAFALQVGSPSLDGGHFNQVRASYGKPQRRDPHGLGTEAIPEVLRLSS